MTDDQKEQVNALQDKLPDIELSNKTIKWMAHYDINLVMVSQNHLLSHFSRLSTVERSSTFRQLGITDILILLRQLWLTTHLTSSLLTTWTHSLRVLSRPCSTIDDVVDFSSDICHHHRHLTIHSYSTASTM